MDECMLMGLAASKWVRNTGAVVNEARPFVLVKPQP